MSIKYAILGILAERDLHGYELKTNFDDKVGEFWSLNFGQIYSTLDRLEKDGLVTHDRQAQDKRPDRKIFSITKKGRIILTQWLSTPISKVRALRDEFFIKLVFMDKDNPAAVLDLIEKQKMLHLKHMNRLTRRKVALKSKICNRDTLPTELLLDAGLFHAEADIKWLTLCETKIKTEIKRKE
ncbi:MAG: PadR family transcriptional regulator [Desulfocapsaceae bacterium]|nr:PadR family transcriptional regulator [Desulfocapsaceae bacterium]